MWTPSLVFLVIVASAYGSLMQYPAKVGDRVLLDLGNDVKTWKRVRKSGVDEFIKYCGPTENGPRCRGFVTADNTPALPETKARVFSNGTLEIESLKATDVGLYSSPDQTPLTINNPDGSQGSVLRNHISLVLQ